MTHATPNAPPNDGRAERIRDALEAARRQLLETSVRSRLLHTPLDSSRAKLIEVHDERADQVFDLLVRDAGSMSFAPKRDGAQRQLSTELEQPDEDLDPRRHNDSVLQTDLPSDKLQSRLRTIANDAAMFESEQGVNVLYLALGFLEWYEPNRPDVPRFAPLILVPLSLTRQSANSKFKVAYTGEELQTNVSLRERLKEEGIELPELPDAEDLAPSEYARAIADRIATVPKWNVDANRMALGLFSFARLMMYRDLDCTLWPPIRNPANHELIGALLDSGFGTDPTDDLPDDAPVDPVIDIAAAGHVVDADSSQCLVIKEVDAGHHLVVQGPPGTGKSQTITNIIAAAVRSGKRVLFVAEKMAALEVVRSNLDKVGLGGLCLELHSHKAKKKSVLDSLRETFENGRSVRLPDGELAARLRDARDALNKHAARIHTPLPPSNATPFRIFGRIALLVGSGLTPPEFELPAAEQWTSPDAETRQLLVKRLAEHVAAMGIPTSHPWRGVCASVLLPLDAQRLGARAAALAPQLDQAIASVRAIPAPATAFSTETLQNVAQLLELGRLMLRAPDLDSNALSDDIWDSGSVVLAELVASGAKYLAIKQRFASTVRDEAWTADVSSTRRAVSAHGSSWLRWLNSEYRAGVRHFASLIKGEPPRSLAERLKVLDAISEAQRLASRVQSQDGTGRVAFGLFWRGIESDWAHLQAIEAWVTASRQLELPGEWRKRVGAVSSWRGMSRELQAADEALRPAREALDRLCGDLQLDTVEAFNSPSISAVKIVTLGDRLRMWGAQPDRIREWATWRALSREAESVQLQPIVERIRDGRLPASGAVDSFEFACYEALARKAFRELPELAGFHGRSHDQIVEAFRKLDRQRADAARLEVLAAHASMIPRGSAGVGEVGLLAREWTKRVRHLPLRQLIKRAGSAMQMIKPVWMMSPMSLAQYVEQGTLDFDLVVMDEASQVTPVDALGAIARAKQIVVVGDEKQLPPTPFFDRVAGDEQIDEEEEGNAFNVGTIESILGLCSAQGMPSRMLRWHYRSQHESLIAISNLEFYKKLYIVPSATSENLGLSLTKVNGTYDRGRTRVNRIEARAVAEAVLAHARKFGTSARYPEGMSLGVGAFSVTQRDAILDELEVLRRRDPSTEAFFSSGAAEPFFVKNLESIQGDERDVIFISIGYGRDESGYMSMAFGPLTSQGGERRLNVLISRARRRCQVFSSITSDDVRLSGTSGAGVRVLKTFLRYAETGMLDQSAVGARPPDSDFEEDVGMALAGLGYEVEHQVGVAGFWIDLAVRDPHRRGAYLLGIECDGATYHSSRSARDRDRIREQVLRDRGWRIHRIWSTDWFNSRSQELDRLVAAVVAAGHSPPPDTVRRATPAPTMSDAEVAPVAAPAASAPQHLSKYREADFREFIAGEPHDLPLPRRCDIVVRILEIEGVMHQDEIARRFATVCGKQRAGGRIGYAVQEALGYAVRHGRLACNGPFFSIRDMASCPARDRSDVRSSTLKDPQMLPPIEIRAALLSVVEDHVSVMPEEAITSATRLFGFQRAGPGLRQVFDDQLRQLLAEGQLTIRNGNRIYRAG